MILQDSKQINAALFDKDKIDFGQYWQTIQRHRWRILGLAVLITAAVALIALSMTPVYRATSSLLIEAEEAKVVSIEEIYGLNSSKKEYFQTQYEILRSRQIAEKVVDKLNLVNHPIYARNEETGVAGFISGIKTKLSQLLPFLPQTSPASMTQEERREAKREQVTARVTQNLTISPVKNTQVVKISFDSKSPELAAEVANAVASAYFESYLDAKFDMTSRATTWLNDSISGLREKLTAAEAALANFYEQNQVVEIDGVAGLASEELQNLSKELANTESLLKQSEIIYQEVQAQRNSVDGLANLPEVLNHPSIQSIMRAEVEAQSRVSELSKVYGPKHQKMVSAVAELNSIEQSLNRQIDVLVTGITTEYQQLQTRVASLRDEVKTAKQEFRKLTMLDSQRQTYQREVEINQQLYNAFLTRLKETSEVESFESANARVLDEARPPAAPTKPNKPLIIGAAFIVSLGVGAALTLLGESMNRGIRSVEDVERKLGQRMLGIIPSQPHSKKEDLPLRQFFDKKHHVFSEAIRTLRTGIHLLHLDKPHQVIMVTSSEPQEGKSTVSVNLAFAMGQLEKVLLIEADLRRPTMANHFGFPGFQPGLANLIAGTHSLSECIVNDVSSGIDVICAGRVPPNPQELLASPVFKAFMKSVRDQYEYIIVDTAPTQAVSDAVVVSHVCDTLLYVVKADSTDEKLINSGIARFMQGGKRVDGVVLNQVDISKAEKSYDYAGFYDRHGYHSNTAEQT